MVDNLSSENRIKTMRSVKGKGTYPERRFFAMLAGMGCRGWRKNVKELYGKPDVVFFNNKIAIFIDGCFWHGCPICERKIPVTNHEYWEHKVKRNVELAEINNKRLLDEGWIVIRYWEHDIKTKDGIQQIKSTLRNLLDKGRD
ncbi:MAG: very short patch repair endonuclease [Bellilinea sp.]